MFFDDESFGKNRFCLTLKTKKLCITKNTNGKWTSGAKIAILIKKAPSPVVKL